MKNIFVITILIILFSKFSFANNTPVAQSFPFGVKINTPTLIDMSKYVSDLDGDILSLTILNDSTNLKGKGVINGMEISYTPETNFVGTQYIKYQVCDQNKACAIGTIIVSINALGKINASPKANYFSQGIKTNTPTLIETSKHISDIDGDSLTVTVTIQPDNGVVKMSGNDILFTPNTNFIGEDFIVYQVCDTLGGCASATIDLFINSKGNINQIPLAKDFSVGVKVNTITILEVNKFASDPDGDILITSIEAAPKFGTAIVSGKNISYTPNKDFKGDDAIFYQVCDSSYGCAIAMISITVNTTGKINQYPIANYFAVAVKTNTATLLEVSKNSSDPDGDVLTTQLDATPKNGIAVISGKDITYTPNKDFTGEDYLTYQVCDPSNACSYASISIVINATGKLNKGPIANDFSVGVKTNIATLLEISKNSSDPDGDILSTSILVNASNGTATLSGKEILYTPTKDFKGADFITYQVCDPSNVCSNAKITISVNPAGTINKMPVANSFDVGIKTNTPTSLEVSKNSSDADGDLLTTTILTMPANGTATVSGKEIIFTPTKDFVGSDNIVYQVCDLYNTCGVGNISITVNALGKVNQWPDSKDITTTLKSNTSIIFDLTSTISDPDGDSLSVSIDESPLFGTATISGKQLTYTPDGTIKIDTIGIRVCDKFDACAFSNIYISIVLSVEELNPVISNIKVFPNPFSKELNLSYSLDDNSNVKIELNSILGNSIFEINYNNQSKGNYKIDLSNQLNDKGIYYLSLTIAGKRHTTKIVKTE